MKSIFTLFIIFLGFYPLPFKCYSQCKPFILIDGNAIIADENDPDGLRLPTWLKAAQTLNVGQYVYSISVIEFTINGTALDYSANLKIPTDGTTVPSGKVWKIEAIHKNVAIPSFAGRYSYTVAGTFTFVSPPCSLMANIRVYGAGGGGSGGWSGCCTYPAGGGGGGGGYAEGFYLLPPSTSYTVVVGNGGNAGTVNGNGTDGTSSSVSVVSISASGGIKGTISSGSGSGGAAGTGSGQLNFTGQAGFGNSGTTGGKGGSAANDGAAGGGGAGGKGGSGTAAAGVDGADGRVDIIIGTGSAVADAKTPCATMIIYGDQDVLPNACPSGWTEAGLGWINFYGGSSKNYHRTCYRCE